MWHLLALLMLAPAAAMAAPDPAPKPLPSEVRLSDAEKEKVLAEAATSKRERPSAESGTPPRQASGEASVSIGSGGYRSGEATAYLPVGQAGLAIISIGTSDLGTRRRDVGPPHH